MISIDELATNNLLVIEDRKIQNGCQSWLLIGAAKVISYSNIDRLNTLRPRQLSEKLQTPFSNAFCSMKMFEFFIIISLKFASKGPIDNKSVLAQVMAWRRRATSHYLNQWWPSSLTHKCVTRPQWVKIISTVINMTKATSCNYWVGLNVKW